MPFGRTTAVVAVVVCLATLFPTWLAESGALWIVRGVLVVLMLSVAGVIASRNPDLLISPLLLLGSSALVFFCLGPELFVLFVRRGPDALTDAFHPLQLERAAAVLGSPGEFLILQFSALCLAATLAAAALARMPAGGDSKSETPLPRNLVPWTAFVIVGLAVLAAFRLQFLQSAAIVETLGARVVKDVFDGLAPWISIGFAALAHQASIRRGRLIWLCVAVGAALLALLMTAGSSKPAVFMVLLGFGLIVARTRLSARAVAGLVALAIVAPIVVGAAVYAVRWSTISPIAKRDASFATILLRGAAGKVLLRQSNTRYCFDAVVRDHYGRAAEFSPVYFLAALVPRYLWPDKPNLSMGNTYSRRYCGLEHREASPHSASITLLGEPVARAGRLGLVTAQATLILVLGAATVVGLRAGPVAHVSLLGAMPWMIDFDQHFALYVAGGVKAVLYMAPVILLLAYLRRRVRSSPSASADDFATTRPLRPPPSASP